MGAVTFFPTRRSSDLVRRAARGHREHDAARARRLNGYGPQGMPLQWILFNLTGTLVDPSVMAQPLGDSGADEDLVLAALDDAITMAMADALTGALTPLDELVEAAMRRRLRLAGSDETKAAAARELMGTMPAYIEVPGALESLRARGMRLGVLAQSATHATDSVLRFAGLRDRFELVLSAQEAGAYKPDLRGYRMAIERTGV